MEETHRLPVGKPHQAKGGSGFCAKKWLYPVNNAEGRLNTAQLSFASPFSCSSVPKSTVKLTSPGVAHGGSDLKTNVYETTKKGA